MTQRNIIQIVATTVTDIAEMSLVSQPGPELLSPPGFGALGEVVLLSPLVHVPLCPSRCSLGSFLGGLSWPELGTGQVHAHSRAARSPSPGNMRDELSRIIVDDEGLSLLF